MSVPVIELEGVSRVYPGPPPVPALVDAHVRIHEGEYVTVVGPSGSGKSTFLNRDCTFSGVTPI
jgi:putative ABC transport system ATP-binding protein